MNELTKANWENQIALVKTMVAKEASDEEFELMLHMARKYSLDPLTKQIWLVKYRGAPANIFAGRDGFLDIAHRSGAFNGMDTEVETVEQPIDKTYTFWNKKTNKQETGRLSRPWQFKAVCTVYRKDMTHPISAEVFEEEYTTCQNLWKDKPRTMIAKVAESQALRKAFQISGLYSPEEMPEQEKDITPIRPEVNAAQAEFEKSKGITSEVKENPPAEQEPAFTPEQIAEAEAQRLKKEEGERRKARVAKMPDDVIAYFRAKGFLVGKVIAILDENEDDPERIRAYMKDNPIESKKVESLAEHLRDEKVPDAV